VTRTHFVCDDILCISDVAWRLVVAQKEEVGGKGTSDQNSLGDLTINYRKGKKNQEELEKLNLREDLVPDPDSDKSIFALLTPSLCR
jgi:hypothetical protein